MAVEIDTAGRGDVFRADTPKPLSDNLRRSILTRNYDVAADDKGILYVESVDRSGPPDQITVVVNWFEALR